MTERIVPAQSGGLDTPVAVGGITEDGLSSSPLERALDQFLDGGRQHVTGDVRVVLGPGTAPVDGRRSPVSLYDSALATGDEGDTVDQSLAQGSAELGDLPSRTAAERDLTAGCSSS